jgi:hypothetical protein
MQLNNSAKRVWKSYDELPRMQLPDGLAKKLQSKFIEVSGCYLLESTVPLNYLAQFKADPSAKQNKKWADEFFTPAGFEHALSKIHIEDYVEDRHLDYAISYIAGVFKLFASQYPDKILRGIISRNNGFPPENIFSCCVSHHLVREDDQLIPDETFDEKQNEENDSDDLLLTIDSNELFKLHHSFSQE